MHMPHAHNAFTVQEKQKQDAAAANGKAPRQSAGELRVQKGANELFRFVSSSVPRAVVTSQQMSIQLGALQC